jgi:hypothetical protein
MVINETILICGVIKNAEKYISKNIDLAIETGNLFLNYQIIVYENNSTDSTKNILKNYEKNEKIHVICEDISDEIIKQNSRIWAYTEITGSDHPCRIEQISNARNKLIEHINEQKFETYTYVMWIDLDSEGWDLNGIVDSFDKKNDWDVVYANGINRYNNKYYDMYALRTSDYIFGPELVGEYFWKNLKTFILIPNNNLISVYSAFGGIGIYKKKIFNKYKFDCIVNKDVQEFYIELLTKKKKNVSPEIMNIISNPDTKFPGGFYDKKRNIFWKNNSGYNNSVVCEHVCLNLKLKNLGYKLYINPKMFYYKGA